MRRIPVLLAAGALLAASTATLADRLSFGISVGPGPYYGYGPGPAYYPRPYYAPRYVYRPYYGYPVYGPPVYYAYNYPPPPPSPVIVERYIEPPPPRVQPAPPPRVEPNRSARPSAPLAAIPPQRFEKVTLSATELFEFDRAELRGPQEKLDDIARALKENPGISHVAISGYTDRLGSDEYNRTLSQRRAEAVKSYLVRQGVEANRLEAVGKGESNPVVQCNQKDEGALIRCLEPNRRVEVEQITIEKKVAPQRG